MPTTHCARQDRQAVRLLPVRQGSLRSDLLRRQVFHKEYEMIGRIEDAELIPARPEDDSVLLDVIRQLSGTTELRRSSAEIIALMSDPTAGPPATMNEWANAIFHELIEWHREKPFRERERRRRAEEAKRLEKERKRLERERRRKELPRSGSQVIPPG